MPTTLDTTIDRLELLAQRLHCTPSDLVLYLGGYRESLPSLPSDATFRPQGDSQIAED